MIFDFNFKELTSRKKIVIVLAVLTGVLHLIYALTGMYPRVSLGLYDYLFISNFIGNIIFITALYFMPIFKHYREYIRWGFILFTLSSILAYFVSYAPGGIASILLPAGVFDKLLEITLIIFLIMDRPLEEPKQVRTSATTTST